jgi:hypothetical protein
MNKLLVLPVVVFLIFSSCEYDSGVSEAFTKYRFKEGVTSITIPGWVIGLASNLGDLQKEERELLRCIDKVRILTIEDNDLNARTNFHKEFYRSISQNPELEELLVVRDGDEQVTIFGKASEKSIDELLILVGGDDNTMIYVKGRLKPELVSDLINNKSHQGFMSWKN